MGKSEMSKMKTISLVVGGFVAGAMISLHVPALADKDAKAGLPIDELRTFAEVYSGIKQGYVEPVEDKTMINNAISGMLSNLDPHSAYLDADAFKDLQVGTQGEFGGLGIEVGMEDGLVKVVSPIEDTPAYRAGVKSGDLIFKLDDTPVKGLTLNEAVKKMRGKPKTSIRLSILRKGEAKPIELTLLREVIKVQSVKSKLIEPGYGWVRITQFQENTTAELAKHLTNLYKGGSLQGLVLDLRNDPGGLLNSAIGVSAAFLPPDVKIVSTDGRAPDAKQEFLARPQDYLRGTREDPLKTIPIEAKKVPMVILVNSGSASASEIVAGALQDYKRGIIMGTQTFGKGSVQSVIPLPGNTAIKLTTARYYTPDGRSIQAKGIVPDIVVEETTNGNGSGASGRIREADLDRHLMNDRDKDAAKEAQKPQAKPAAKTGKDKGGKDETDEETLARLEYGTKSDYQFQQALNLLKGLKILQSKTL
ncbi:MAG: S41 family peptidase [Candidatus Dechloromonas phosphoritropha]|nr:S41 family peptidase [Candidatus Dechloromonas phosphoritropha]